MHRRRPVKTVLEAVSLGQDPSESLGEGLLELGVGRPSEALERLLVPITSVLPQSNPMVVRAVPDAVEAATRTQQLDEVSGAFKRYESWVERFPHPTRLALLARCRALIDESGAERHYTDALSLDAPPPFDRARTELLYGAIPPRAISSPRRSCASPGSPPPG